MQNIQSKLHDIAMELAFEADRAAKRGDLNSAYFLWEKAYKMERDFALAIPREEKYDLSRSVFLRSAATLALNCGQYEDAILIAENALKEAFDSTLVPELKEIIKAAKEKQAEIKDIFIDQNSN